MQGDRLKLTSKQKELQKKEDFKYSSDWYNDYYGRTCLCHINSKEDLEKSILHDGNNNSSKYVNMELKGVGLDLGFCNGRSLYYISRAYKNITIDAIDWASCFEKIIPYIKELCSCVNELKISNINKIDKEDNYYDFITSLDTFEHLNESDYFLCIKECYRVLKDGGMFYVYFGQPDNPSHINRRLDANIIEEIKLVGFTHVRSTTKNLLIFTKE